MLAQHVDGVVEAARRVGGPASDVSRKIAQRVNMPK
jgi:hypothetical protein